VIHILIKGIRYHHHPHPEPIGDNKESRTHPLHGPCAGLFQQHIRYHHKHTYTITSLRVLTISTPRPQDLTCRRCGTFSDQIATRRGQVRACLLMLDVRFVQKLSTYDRAIRRRSHSSARDDRSGALGQLDKWSVLDRCYDTCLSFEGRARFDIDLIPRLALELVYAC